MNHIISVALLLASTVALAEEVRVSGTNGNAAGPAFSAVGAKTVGSGGNMLDAAIGYPGAHVSFMHGVRNDLDLGGRLSFNGAYEGMAPIWVTGFKAQGVAKLRFFERGRWTMGLEAAPGAFLYGAGSQTVGGIAFPVAFKVGIAATDIVSFGLTAETPFFVSFAPLYVPAGRNNQLIYPASVYLPVLGGGGVEIAVLKNLLVTFDTRLGATYIGAWNRAELTAQALAGVAWRI